MMIDLVNNTVDVTHTRVLRSNQNSLSPETFEHVLIFR